MIWHPAVYGINAADRGNGMASLKHAINQNNKAFVPTRPVSPVLSEPVPRYHNTVIQAPASVTELTVVTPSCYLTEGATVLESSSCMFVDDRRDVTSVSSTHFVLWSPVDSKLCLQSLTLAVCFPPFPPLLLCCPLTFPATFLSSVSSSDHGQKAQGEPSLQRPSGLSICLLCLYMCLLFATMMTTHHQTSFCSEDSCCCRIHIYPRLLLLHLFTYSPFGLFFEAPSCSLPFFSSSDGTHQCFVGFYIFLSLPCALILDLLCPWWRSMEKSVAVLITKAVERQIYEWTQSVKGFK